MKAKKRDYQAEYKSAVKKDLRKNGLQKIEYLKKVFQDKKSVDLSRFQVTKKQAFYIVSNVILEHKEKLSKTSIKRTNQSKIT